MHDQWGMLEVEALKPARKERQDPRSQCIALAGADQAYKQAPRKEHRLEMEPVNLAVVPGALPKQ